MKNLVRNSIYLILPFAATLFLYNNCSGSMSSASSSAPTPTSTSTSTPTTTGTASPVALGQANVMAITVGCGYSNEPCVSVTICVPGTNNCQTIPNVLLDTGSYGLRLFNQVSTDNFMTAATALIRLPGVVDPNNSANLLSECVSYDGGNSDWGSLATADVQLGTETASSVPIQIINPDFATVPSDCLQPDESPLQTGYNGILGVGLFAADCGDGCAPPGNADNGIYFSCPATGGGACSGVAVANSVQTTNPVALLPTDNNGVILELPSVPIAFGLNDGSGAVSGFLVLGIGTETNNIPSGTTVFPADQYGNFVTTFNGVTASDSFIDSGSNAYYFPQPSGLPTCLDDSSFYCPTSEMTFQATQSGANGTGSSQTISFSIGNADDDYSSSNPNINFADIGGTFSSGFDWGLPFFYGRNIYVGLDGTSSVLGSGPIWSY